MKRIFTYVVLGVLLLILTGCAFQTNDNDAQMEEKLKQLQETVAVLQEQNAKEQEEQKVKDEEVQFYYTPINADWGTQEEDTQPINPYDSIEEAKENVIRLNGYVNIDSVNGYT